MCVGLDTGYMVSVTLKPTWEQENDSFLCLQQVTWIKSTFWRRKKRWDRRKSSISRSFYSKVNELAIYESHLNYAAESLFLKSNNFQVQVTGLVIGHPPASTLAPYIHVHSPEVWWYDALIKGALRVARGRYVRPFKMYYLKTEKKETVLFIYFFNPLLRIFFNCL